MLVHYKLLQDLNILRPLIYITADNIGINPLILVTSSLIKRDKSKIWIKEIQEIADETNGSVYIISNLVDVWRTLNEYTNGFIISASESDLNAHKETHEIFRLAPSNISTITLQHGFECVGFLMNSNHQNQHGSSVGFASDYICGWTPAHLQRNLRPLQYSRYHNLGPTAWLKQTNKRNLSLNINNKVVPEMGIVCENLHSVRFGGKSNVNLFMQQFFELADYLDSKGKKIALRPHPGGQYSIKNNPTLPNNVLLVNQPSYKVNWRSFLFGISAPSSVLFDLMINEVPVIVWQDPQQIIDITQLSFLPSAQNTQDMISFSDFPVRAASFSTNQQLSAIFRDDYEVTLNYTQFLSKLCGRNSNLALTFPNDPANTSKSRKIRVLLIAPAIIPTLTISFINPFSLLSDLIEYKIIHGTGDDILDGESIKDANIRRCKNILSTFQPDVLVMCRYANKDALQLAATCTKMGIKVIYHIDDLLFEPSLEVLDEKKYFDYKKRAPTILELIKRSDLVYCSTPALRKELLNSTKHQNVVSGKIYKSVDHESIIFHKNRKKVIGYTGFGHTQDLESIEDALLEVLSEYDDWSLELIGTMAPSSKLLSLEDRIHLIPPEKDYDAFISLLKSREWSIGICPLISNRFNSLKANTKWIEYSYCNIATVVLILIPTNMASR